MSNLAFAALFEYLYGMGLQPLDFWIFSGRDRLYTSESDVCRRQIVTYKDGPRPERAKVPRRLLFCPTGHTTLLRR